MFSPSMEPALTEPAAPPGAPPVTLRPMRAGLARMVAALRGAVAVVGVAAAITGATSPVSWAWLGPALALVAGWTAVYAAVAWSRGLRPWLVGLDLAVAAALGLAVGHLVPAAALPGTFSWVSLIVSMTVVSAQLAGGPPLSVPAGLLAAVAFVAGQRLAGGGDDLTSLLVLVAQVLIGAAVMVAALRVERTAVGSFLDLQRARAAAALALARREDERAQLRVVHNGPLTTLTMALHSGSSPTLRKRAAAVLAELPALAPGPGAAAGRALRLDERLTQVVAWYRPSLRVAADLRPVPLPAAVAEAITSAVSEALENVVRHAGTDAAVIDLTGDADAVCVSVTDRGRGFDPAAMTGFGLREDLAGRMDAIGGTATVRSVPGAGTTVRLEWHRG